MTNPIDELNPSVTELHPTYSEARLDWDQTWDCYQGSRHIKERMLEYLPATSGMIFDGMKDGQPGRAVYNGYLKRAVFPEFTKSAVTTLVGLMHSKAAVIELPEEMEGMRDNATIHGESLQDLLRRTTTQQWVRGRFGYLVELPDGGGPDDLPYIATYEANTILNWDDGEREQGRQILNMVMLDESHDVRQADFSWKWQIQTRYLILGDLFNDTDGDGEAGPTQDGDTYKVAVMEDGSRPEPGDFIEPRHATGGVLTQIPFVFINSRDLLPDPDQPPLLSLSNLDLTVYRGEADYRQALFEQAQETLVVIGQRLTHDGEGQETRVGAGAMLELTAGSDAKYIGPNSQGLPEMRNALENDRSRADALAGRLQDNRSKQRESGEALKIRASAETATLSEVAMTAAAALEQALRIAGRWMGLSDEKLEEIRVEANKDFVDAEDSPIKLVELNRARKEGYPLSKETLHKYAQDRGYTDKDFEEETELIEAEAPDVDEIGGFGLGVPGDPASTEEPPGQNEAPDATTPPGAGGPPE